jgi:hypothetical protein
VLGSQPARGGGDRPPGRGLGGPDALGPLNRRTEFIFYGLPIPAVLATRLSHARSICRMSSGYTIQYRNGLMNAMYAFPN